MKNIAIINGLSLSPYAYEPLKGEKNTLHMVAEYAHALPDVDEVFLLTTSACPRQDVFSRTKVIEDSMESLLSAFSTLGKGYTHIFYFYADTPFLDPGLALKMHENHIRYFAEYSFADGFPGGVSCEIITTSILARLVKLGPSGPVHRDGIFELIKKDINSFDIETEIASSDLRLLRVCLSADSRRNFLLLKRIAPLFERIDQIPSIIEKNASILRTLPIYFNIQIARDCPQDCHYCPYPGIRNQDTPAWMTEYQLKQILEKISGFCGDAIINLSLWGEIAQHPQLMECIAAVLAYENFSLLIETTGLGWNPEILLPLKEQYGNRITWIVSLDAHNEQVYRRLRGDGYEEARETATKLRKLFPDTAYIQAVRMDDNEDDLEEFYSEWKEETEHIIIQKYDHFCRTLDDKKVTDLSPVKRFPCWHLKRDVAILLDGTVPLCREDLTGNYALGNIFKDSLELIWGHGEAVYKEHLEGRYNTLCEKCDEYYTYNF